MNQKQIPVCRTCGKTEIHSIAAVSWNIERQEFVAGEPDGVFECGFCSAEWDEDAEGSWRPLQWEVISLDRTWHIRLEGTGRTVKIGPVWQPRSQSKVNYRDRAQEEADRRNREAMTKPEQIEPLCPIPARFRTEDPS